MENGWPLDYWVIAPSGLCIAKMAFRDDALLLIEACKENLKAYLRMEPKLKGKLAFSDEGEYRILYKGAEE